MAVIANCLTCEERDYTDAEKEAFVLELLLDCPDCYTAYSTASDTIVPPAVESDKDYMTRILWGYILAVDYLKQSFLRPYQITDSNIGRKYSGMEVWYRNAEYTAQRKLALAICDCLPNPFPTPKQFLTYKVKGGYSTGIFSSQLQD